MGESLRDPLTFERAYREYGPGAHAAARRVLRDPVAADDVVQEVFTQLWNRPNAFDERRGSLHAYITMLARSRAIDHCRSQAARERAAGRLKASAERDVREERSPAEQVLERERSATVVSLVDRLPASQREAVLLAYANDMTAPEIGAVVGVPTGTVKSRVRLGLEKLREAHGSVA